jgi:hypothetical protein
VTALTISLWELNTAAKPVTQRENMSFANKNIGDDAAAVMGTTHIQNKQKDITFRMAFGRSAQKPQMSVAPSFSRTQPVI